MWIFLEGEIYGVGNVQHEIGIDNVVERLQKYGQEAESGEESRERGYNPVDIGLVARPSEPEQSRGKGYAPGNHGGETPFGDRDVVVGSQFPVVGRLHENNGDAGHKHTQHHPEIGKPPDTEVHTVDALEDDRVGG